MNTGSHTAMEVGVPVYRRWVDSGAKMLGCTRWASPPPAPGWRVYLLVLLLGDAGLILIALDAGWIRLP